MVAKDKNDCIVNSSASEGDDKQQITIQQHLSLLNSYNEFEMVASREKTVYK